MDEYARQALNSSTRRGRTFTDMFYIGRHLLYGDRHHKFFYVGHYDLFGVAAPEGSRMANYQLWGPNWVRGRSKKLDAAIDRAMRGKFPDCRHNTRAINNGAEFIKPTWNRPNEAAAAIAVAKEKNKLPIRKRTSKRSRRKLNV